MPGSTPSLSDVSSYRVESQVVTPMDATESPIAPPPALRHNWTVEGKMEGPAGISIGSSVAHVGRKRPLSSSPSSDLSLDFLIRQSPTSLGGPGAVGQAGSMGHLSARQSTPNSGITTPSSFNKEMAAVRENRSGTGSGGGLPDGFVQEIFNLENGYEPISESNSAIVNQQDNVEALAQADPKPLVLRYVQNLKQEPLETNNNHKLTNCENEPIPPPPPYPAFGPFSSFRANKQDCPQSPVQPTTKTMQQSPVQQIKNELSPPKQLLQPNQVSIYRIDLI